MNKLITKIHEELGTTKATIIQDERVEQASFEYNDSLTGLKTIHKINILKSIEQQDVFSWTLAFREISRICNWSMEAQTNVLKHIVSIDIQYRIGAPADTNLYINLLLKQKYNHETSHKYYSRLSSLKQINYYTIRKYLHEIEINCQKLGLCLNWNNDLIQQKQHEIFFNGLDTNAKLELSKYFRKEFKSVYESILTTECMLIENMESIVANIREYNHNVFENHNTPNQQSSIQKMKSSSNKKYCSFHKSNTHSDQECRMQKRKQTKNVERNDTEKILALQEPKPIAKSILISIVFKNKSYSAMLDTGSEYNYVSEAVIRNNPEISISSINKKVIELANGTTTSISTLIDDEIMIFNDERMKIKERFYVLEGLNFSFLLGMEFFLKNNVILNLKNKSITIDGSEYELDVEERSFARYDESLAENTRVYQSQSDENQLKKLVLEYKRKNPKIGQISQVEHEIQLKSDFEPPKCDYGVPLALQDDVRKHLNDLENDGIIKQMDTPYISPAFFLRKSNGKLRLIIDYRKLNSITVKAHNFRPKIQEILNKLNGCTYFTKIDLHQGFY
ncbi:Retrovirus-related Pol polyprotein from transposon [Dictyocoela muelleri]|nr:Retrovirus-related Pol polyprotein from transposon [Dictyocoela muelleri]